MTTTATGGQTSARYAARKRWLAARRRGESRTPVPTDDVRERLERWREHHFAMSLVSRATNVSSSTLSNILSGRYQTCYVDAANAILELNTPDLFKAVETPVTKVPSFATRRRFEALIAAGWTSAKLDRVAVAHRKPAVAAKVARAKSSSVLTASFIHESMKFIYEAVGENVAPSDRAMGYAHYQGWLPPQAWEGLDIDDPEAKPLAYWERTSS